MKYLRNVGLMALLWLPMLPAYAAMVATHGLTAEPERAQMASSMAQRQHVQQQLIELGVEPAAAVNRVNQMTDQQIANLQGKITELPAGAGISTTDLLLVIILVILLL
ncbi:MAG: PA2779 family protein [Gammaproteobacteria bacterium]|nr:PA2779 family protein [Gammaproteobacteria bacterium]